MFIFILDAAAPTPTKQRPHEDLVETSCKRLLAPADPNLKFPQLQVPVIQRSGIRGRLARYPSNTHSDETWRVLDEILPPQILMSCSQPWLKVFNNHHVMTWLLAYFNLAFLDTNRSKIAEEITSSVRSVSWTQPTALPDHEWQTLWQISETTRTFCRTRRWITNISFISWTADCIVIQYLSSFYHVCQAPQLLSFQVDLTERWIII